jgi:type IV pilus assembly protein PilV
MILSRHSVPVVHRRCNGVAATAKRMRGISLIEVLVSVLVLGVGMLGIAAMQSMALRGGQSSLESTQAVMQTTAIIEAMRANSLNVASYNTGGMRCAAATATTLAGNDLNAWVSSLQNTITRGDATACGQIACVADDCLITVQWDDQRAGGGTRQIVTRASI